MEKMIDYKTGVEIYRQGYKILAKELGVIDFIRFIQEFDMGEGDYTVDRHKWQDNYSVKELVEILKN